MNGASTSKFSSLVLFLYNQDTYLVEISDPLPTLPGLPLEFSHGLDNTEEGTIALNLLPMVAASPERLRAMAAHFHLLCVLTMTQHNNLEEVDALLGMCVSFQYLDPRMEHFHRFSLILCRVPYCDVQSREA